MASDILRLAISPNSRFIINLFAIVLIRILLNYFLDYEFKTIEAYQKSHEYDA